MTRLPRTLPFLLVAVLLAGCSSLIGGPRETPSVYAPQPKIHTEASWPAVRWSLAIARAGEERMQAEQRLLVSPVAGELQTYRGALWARTPADMVETSVLQTLEDSGKIVAVARQGSGIAADYRLLLEIRSFQADLSNPAAAVTKVEVNAKLLHLDEMAIVGSHNFSLAQPADGPQAAQLADAFSAALGTLGHDMAGWALSTGQAHQQQAHAKPVKH